MSWTQILSELANGIVAFLATIGMVIGFISVMILMTGCGSSGEIRSVVEQGVEAVEAGEDAARTAGDLAEEAGETFEKTKEAGQKLKGLSDKQIALELQKPTYLNGIEVRVRPAGMNNAKIIPDSSYARYKMSASRFSDAATMTIYTEIRGVPRPVKVKRKYRNDVSGGEVSLLTLVRIGDDSYAWIPPSERDRDQEIIFGN
jgi:hypothetical protein